MESDTPNDVLTAPGEGLLRVVVNLAFWMRCVAVLGILFAFAPMLLFLRENRVGLVSFLPVVFSLTNVILWLDLWICAGHFRRIAKQRDVGLICLAGALWQLSAFFFFFAVLMVACGALGLALLAAGN